MVSAPLCFYLAWQARHLLLCKGRDVPLWRPSGVPWSPRLCASIWRGRRGTCCSARGVMYALASLWRPLGSAPLCFFLARQALSHTHSHSLTHTHTHSNTLHTHSLSHTHSHTLTHNTLTHSLTHTHTHAHTLTLTHTHNNTLTITHSLTHTHSHTLTHSHTHTHSL